VGVVSVVAQGCFDDDFGPRCHDARDCPYGSQCTATRYCTAAPHLLRPGQQRDASTDARLADGARPVVEGGGDSAEAGDDAVDASEMADAGDVADAPQDGDADDAADALTADDADASAE